MTTTVLHKITEVPAKKFAGDQELFPMIVSTENPDRYRDILMQNGWDLKEYLLNNVVLLGHNASVIVGRMLNLRVENRILKGDLQLAPAGISARVDECRALVKNNFLRACSAGFVPISWEDLPNGAKRFTKMKLLEISLVALPANAECLMEAKALGISNETIKMIFNDSKNMTLAEKIKHAREVTRRARALLAKSAPSTARSKSKTPLLTMSDETKSKYARARAATKKARELLANGTVDAAQQPLERLNRAASNEGTWRGESVGLTWRGVPIPTSKWRDK